MLHAHAAFAHAAFALDQPFLAPPPGQHKGMEPFFCGMEPVTPVSSVATGR